MTNVSIRSRYPEARSPVQSQLFSLADLAAKELDGVRVAGVSSLACTPRHRAVALLEHISIQPKEPSLPTSLKDRLAEVFFDTTLAPRSDMDYLLSLRGLSLINPTGSQGLPPSDLTSIVDTMIRERRLTDIELGIFSNPTHIRTCDFLIRHRREVSEPISTKIDFALRAYIDIWPAVPRVAPDASLHPLFHEIQRRDLEAIRKSVSQSLNNLKPPKGW
jgi:hypothetical protein